MYNFKWSSNPPTNDPVIRLFRNYCASELSGKLVYTEGPNFDEWTMAGVMEWVWNNGTRDQYDELIRLYRHQSGMFPFPSAIHQFLRTHDREWYIDTYEANYNHKV